MFSETVGVEQTRGKANKNHSSTNPINDRSVVDALQKRMVEMAISAFEDVRRQPKQIAAFISMNDQDFILEITRRILVSRDRTTEQTKSELRRAESQAKFYAYLREKGGGLLKSNEVQSLTGLTRQTIKNHRDKGLLISIKIGEDFLYPAFQFFEGNKLPGLEEILRLIPEHIGPAHVCSFMLNSLKITDSVCESPVDVLRRKPTKEEMNVLRREASLLGSMDAR